MSPLRPGSAQRKDDATRRRRAVVTPDPARLALAALAVRQLLASVTATDRIGYYCAGEVVRAATRDWARGGSTVADVARASGQGLRLLRQCVVLASAWSEEEIRPALQALPLAHVVELWR